MNLGWICPVCGTANAPHVDSCCTVDVPQTAPQTTAASTANGVAVATAIELAGKKASKATATTRNRYQYNNPEFSQFWEVYPLKRGKAAAYRKFVAAVESGVDAARIIAAATDYRNDPQRDPLYTKWPEGWLAAGRWDDDLEVAAPPRTLASVGPDTFEEQRAARIAEEERAIAEMT